MGLAASQVRFLQLTSRKADIGRELQHLSMEKMALTRDMQKVSQNYQAALSSKTMKWSNNSGVTYADISYGTLMRQNTYNAKSPILITNEAGKVVVDQKYQKYAEMISANGAAGGTWSGETRNRILSEITGISQDAINESYATVGAAGNAANSRDKALEELDAWKAKEERMAGTKYVKVSELAKNLGSVNGKDLSSLYNKADKGDYTIHSSSDIESLINGIKNNMSKFFVDDEEFLKVSDKTEFIKACDEVAKVYKSLVDSNDSDADKSRESFGIKGSKGNWTVDIQLLFNQIMGAYITGEGSYDYNSQNEKTFPIRDTSSTGWSDWYNGLKTRQAAFDAADSGYYSSVNDANMVLDAEQETKIQFYDLLFKAIADNGWVYDMNIEDTDYLNQMFQNNSYYITTINKNQCYDKDSTYGSTNYEYYYDTSVASNFDKIFAVNDSDARDEALVEYEYQKSLINSKESRIDTRMKNLETEQSAISKMLESIDKVKSDNIERTFGIWG